MKIAVLLTQTPDTTTTIKFNGDNTAFDTEGVVYIANPYDEWYALVRAVELKETSNAEVTVITVGKSVVEPVLRKAFAIGADKAVRIDADANDPNYIASQIAMYMREHVFDIIFAGKESIDYNSGEVPGMLAQHLDMPYIPSAKSLEYNEQYLEIHRDAVGGETDVLQVSLPCVVSCAKGMAEQRIPNIRGIMSARKKHVEVLSPFDTDERTSLESFVPRKEKKSCQLFDANQITDLLDKLREERVM